MRFGIFVNGNHVEQWQYLCIENLVNAGHELVLAVVNSNEGQKPKGWQRIKDYPYRRMLFQVWNHYFFKPFSKQPADWHNLAGNARIIQCRTTVRGWSDYFSKEDIETISSHQLDFILRFGFNILRGDILNVAKYGIWSFHHDDERIVRGGPPGFWEFMQHIPTNGIILQRLGNDLDKGFVMRRMELKTCLHSYREHLDNLYFTSTILPVQVCNDIKIQGKLVGEESHSEAPILHPPHNLTMLNYYWKYFARRVAFHFNDLFRQEDWNVGYCEIPIQDFVKGYPQTSDKAHYFKKPHKSCYFADPFATTTAKDTYIFFEWYEYKRGKAAIAVALKSENFEKRHVVLEDDYHHAFPFVFEDEGVVYCLPESAQAGKLNLYRFDEEQLKLVFDSTLLNDCPAVDCTLTKRDGRWFIIGSQKPQASSHLYVYDSDNMRGPYKPHVSNPVKVSASSSRSAGALFSLGGELIRPAQECAEAYGTAVVLNRIDNLSETSFIETAIGKIAPTPSMPYRKGLHTINGNDRLTVFDVKRFCFTFSGLRQQFRQKFHK